MELSGFGDLDNSTKVVIKKMVGNQVKVINDTVGDFNRLTLQLNKADEKYKMSAKIEMNNKVYTSEASDLNLFFALSRVLTGLKKEVS